MSKLSINLQLISLFSLLYLNIRPVYTSLQILSNLNYDEWLASRRPRRLDPAMRNRWAYGRPVGRKKYLCIPDRANEIKD
jgi:hypothetical protein